MQSSIFNLSCYIARYPDLRLNTFIVYNSSGNFGVGNSISLAVQDLNALATTTGTSLFTNIVDQYQLPIDAQAQFNKYGAKENRMGGCDLPGTVYDTAFNSAPYLARYPDLRRNPNFVANPYNHYITIGQKQNRIPGYEILNENSLPGITTPGTTIFVSNNAGLTTAQVVDQQNIASGVGNEPGDNLQVLSQSGTPVVPGTTVVSTSTDPNTIYYYIGGAAIVLILLLHHKKKK